MTSLVPSLVSFLLLVGLLDTDKALRELGLSLLHILLHLAHSESLALAEVDEQVSG